MAWIVFDVQKDTPNFTQKLTLDGSDYTFQFVWNMRSGWYMGLTQGTTVLFCPRKFVVETDLLAQVRHLANCPPGLLVAHDTTGAGLDPGFDDIRGLVNGSRLGRVILAYNDGN